MRPAQVMKAALLDSSAPPRDASVLGDPDTVIASAADDRDKPVRDIDLHVHRLNAADWSD